MKVRAPVNSSSGRGGKQSQLLFHIRCRASSLPWFQNSSPERSVCSIVFTSSLECFYKFLEVLTIYNLKYQPLNNEGTACPRRVKTRFL